MEEITHTILQDNDFDLLANYRRQINTYDEILDANGSVKPHWKKLFDTLQQIGIQELNNRHQEIIRILRENGVTYNVYGAVDGENRHWQLDAIPFLITRSEWDTVNKGLFQRVELLNLILKDVYSGSFNLIKDKIIPPELIFGNKGFLRQCNDIKLPSEHQLLTYAADLARGPDGRMWILDNRTETPSGFGYAYENRKILSRVIPELAQDMYIDRLSPFIVNLQKSFDKLSYGSQRQPLVVFLTPGPRNETYFEQAYLSSYLGCSLVQGDDLLVRDGFVWLKSIEGLQKVDIIMRRVDDEYIDPLELKQDSLLGVPGLLNVIRKGNVVMINPPGVGLLENHSFLAFGNSLAKYYLGEELILPSVATWWCGQQKELNFVLANIDRLIIKKAHRKQKFRSIYGRLLSKQEKEDVIKMILHNPSEFVAQEEVKLSTTPTFTGETIEPRFATIRSFVISDGKEYYSMQGGLTRNSPEKNRFIISNQYGGQSKDTWVISDSPEEYHNNIKLNVSVASSRDNVISSRSAENLYWSGRYCERAHTLCKVTNNIIDILNTYKKFGNILHDDFIAILLKSITHLTLTYPGFLSEELLEDTPKTYAELSDIIANDEKMGSITFNLNNFVRATLNVREMLSVGTFRILDSIDEINAALRNNRKSTLTEKQKHLEKIHNWIFTFYGIINETMTRDCGIMLFEIGKLIERSLSLVNQMQSCICFKNDEVMESEILKTILYNNHSLVRYRSTYKSEPKIDSFLDMMLFETKQPYSVIYQLNKITEYIDGLPNISHNSRMNEAQKAVLEATTLIHRTNLADLSAYNPTTMEREDLDKLLTTLNGYINNISAKISNIYFTHTVQMGSFLKNREDKNVDEI